MKKVIFGSFLSLAGIISTASLLVMAMSKDWQNNDEYSIVWNLSQYGLMPALNCFIAVAIFGFAIAIWGIFEK